MNDLHPSCGAETSDRQLLEQFIAARDEAAFAGLIERHGRMVWRVCRRVLQQEQESEDAFQAVFLVLARRAGSIRKAEAVGSWLYGVAYRIAMRARRQARQRSEREQQAVEVKEEPPTWAAAACRELQRLLDEEIERLAQKYRAPFVLCCLEGMSRAEAARELGLKEGTVASRLAQARALLQKRLARRGVTLSAALAAGALASEAATAPAAVVQAAVAGEPGASPAAVALANRFVRTLDRARHRLLLGLLLLLTTLFTATGVAAWQLGTGPHAQEPAGRAEADTFVPPPVGLGTPIDERILSVAFAPDGKRLITAGGDPTGQVQIWDPATSQNLVTLRGIPGVRSVAFAPDGASFASGDQRGQITLRDAATGAELAMVQGHAGGVASVAFSHDGKFLVSAGPDRALRLWDGQNLQKRKLLLGHTEAIAAVAYFRSGRAIVSGSRDQTALLWDLDAGQVQGTLRGHPGPVTAMAVAPDDRLVATANSDGTLKLWEAPTGLEAAVLQAQGSAVSALAFAPDGTLLAAALADGTIDLWEVQARRRRGQLARHEAEVTALAFAPDSKRLASGSADKTAKIWNVTTGTAIATLRTVSPMIRPIRALAYSPDGTVLAMATRDAPVQIRAAKSGDVLRLLVGHQQEVHCLAFSSDGQTLATGSADKTVKLWDWASGAETRTLQGHTGAVHAVAFTADGKQLASAGQDRAIKLWDARSGQERTGFPGHAAGVRALAFAPDQSVLASGGDDQAIKIWDLARAKETLTLQGHTGAVVALAFSRSGALASGGDDAAVKLWDVAQARERLSLQGHAHKVLALAFTPTGRALVSAGRDHTIHVWDSETGQSRAVLQGHKDAVTALAMHPLGQHLVSGGHDTMLLRWQGAKVAAEAAPVLMAQLDAKGDAPAAGNVVPPAPALPKDFHQDFRGNLALHGAFTWEGKDGEEIIDREERGLRVKLTAKRIKPEHVGVVLNTPFKGDFEITAHYEVVQADVPRSGGGVGVDLYLMFNSPVREAVAMCRVKQPDGSERYRCSRMVDDEGGRQFLPRDEPAFGPLGPNGSVQLRITRTGKELTYAAAEGDEEFRELCRIPVGTDELRKLRMAAFPGHAVEPVDIRLVDLKIRSTGLGTGVPVPPAFPPVAGAAGPGAAAELPVAPAPGRRIWLLAALIVGAAILGMMFFAALLVRRRRSAPRPPDEDELPGLVTTCPGCGKELQARAELAGHRAKCPDCSGIVVLPAAPATAAERTSARPAAPGRRRRMWLAALAGLLALGVGVGVAIWGSGSARHDAALVNLLDQTFGAQPLPEIPDAGFSGPETSPLSGVAYRWTNGAAKFVIPLQEPPPKGLHVRLIMPGLPDYRLAIQANGKVLFEDRLSLNGIWGQTFDLSGVKLGKELTVEILTDTHIPARIGRGNNEGVLGVRFMGLTLLSGNKSYVNVPLGVLDTPEVKETGLLQPDYLNNQPLRWTDGAARLIVPLRGKTPRALAVTLEVPNKPNYQVAITVNGKKLVDAQLPWDPAIRNVLGRDWSAELPLAGVALGENALIELDSSTLVPGEITASHPENRNRPLGVRVKRLLLVADAEPK